MTATVVRIALLSQLCASVVLTSSLPATAEANPTPKVRRAQHFAVSPALRDIARLTLPIGNAAGAGASRLILRGDSSASADAPVEQVSTLSGSNFSINLNFLGLGNGFPNFTPSGAPPNPSLAVGTTQVVQWTDPVLAVFDKSSGAIESGPILSSTIWESLGAPCSTGIAGSELIVEWDKANQRWLLAENTHSGPPYYTCIAVSTGPDALGSYYLYSYSQGTPLWDTPKWGIWSNGYYQTEAEYSNSGFIGPELCAYESAKLVAGDGSAEQICFTLDVSDGLPFPADIDSTLAPPSNEDEFFISLYDSAHLSLYSLHPDYENPQNSTVTGTDGSQLIAVPPFTPACNGNYGGNCVPQKNSSTQLQVLGDRLMYRLAYWEDTPLTSVRATPPRPVPSQHWYALHDSTASGGNEAPRWYEFTAPIRALPVTGISLFQSGTFAPDSNYRWMGSLARDKKYDILLGYSESSSSLYPAIAITGRILSDPLGTMEDELTVVEGTADGGPHWGNYSAMRIDSDGCTFWYTNEYYTISNEWSTQIASAKFAGCQ